MQAQISKVPKGKEHNVTYEQVHCISKELEFSNSYKQNSGEQLYEWTSKVEDNSGRNINMDQTQFLDMGPKSRD